MRQRRKRRRKARSKRIATTEKLAEVLESQNDPALQRMIGKARDGYYDDYKTTIPFPLSQLIMDLEYRGYCHLAQRAKNGEFDAQPWEGKQWMRKEGNALIMDSFDRERRASDNDDGT